MLTPPSVFLLAPQGDPTRARKAAWLGCYAFLKGLGHLCDHLADLALRAAHEDPEDESPADPEPDPAPDFLGLPLGDA